MNINLTTEFILDFIKNNEDINKEFNISFLILIMVLF